MCREAKVSDLKSVLDSLFKHAGDIGGVISLADLAKWSVDQEFGIRLEDGIRVGCYNRFDSLINYVAEIAKEESLDQMSSKQEEGAASDDKGFTKASAVVRPSNEMTNRSNTFGDGSMYVQEIS